MRSLLLLLGVLTVSGASLTGCATDDEAPASAPAALTATVVGLDGTTQTVSGAWDDIFPAGYATLPTFMVDGRPTTDTAAVLDAQRVELMRPDGSRLVIGRVDGRLTMIEGPADNVGRQVRVRFTDSSMFVAGPDGEAEVRLSATNTARLRSYLGRCAIDLLGGHAGLAGVEQGREPVTIITALTALGITAIAACITGQTVCSNHAATLCRGRSGRVCSRQICGVGVDFRGRVRFGMECIVKCGDTRC
jgi:hypothetical protein